MNQLQSLAKMVEKRAPKDGEHLVAIPEVLLFRSSKKSEHVSTLYLPCLCVNVQGAKEVVVGEQTFRYDPAHSLVVAVDLPAYSRVVEATPEHPCLVIRIEIDPTVVGDLIAEGSKVHIPGPSERGVAVHPVDAKLLDAVTRLMNLLDTPEDIAPLSPLILREIIHRVLTGPQGLRLRQIALAGAPAQRISKAIRWLKDHFSDPLDVRSLAKEVGLSPSAFHQHFKNVTAVSPLQYQKRLRLQEARRLMLCERIDAADAGFRVGYQSPSQFSREYRRMFGAPPQQDVTTLRNESPQTRTLSSR